MKNNIFLSIALILICSCSSLAFWADDSDVDVVQLPTGSGSDLSGASLLNVASGTATSGANSSGETILEALARVEEQTGFVGVFSNLQIEDAVVSSTA